MSDIETIKSRVRKLMAVANDGVATDAEIDTAMRLAAKLIDQHHIDATELGSKQDAEDLTMGEAGATTRTGKLTTWESTLANAIVKLFGSVQHYISHERAPVRDNGVVQMRDGGPVFGRRMFFYGPVVEAREAAELFEEWSRAIATMGVARWGGAFRGEGAHYCYGFASALYEKALQVDGERARIEARPIPQLQGSQTTAITLSSRYELLRDAGSEWIEKERGLKLRSSSRSGYSNLNGQAYGEGRAHGSRAGFGRATQRRRLAGPQ